MSEDIRKILEEKNIIYEKVLTLLERKAQEEIKRGGNVNNIVPNITSNKNHMTLEQAMNNSFDRIRKYSKRNI